MPLAAIAPSSFTPNVYIPLAPMGALASETVPSDTDSLLDSLDLEAQMAQERLTRRTTLLRKEATPLLDLLPPRMADAGRAAHRGGRRLGEHLSTYACQYIAGLIFVGVPVAIFTLRAHGQAEPTDVPSTQANVTAAILGAHMTIKRINL